MFKMYEDETYICGWCATVVTRQYPDIATAPQYFCPKCNRIVSYIINLTNKLGLDNRKAYDLFQLFENEIEYPTIESYIDDNSSIDNICDDNTLTFFANLNSLKCYKAVMVEEYTKFNDEKIIHIGKLLNDMKDTNYDSIGERFNNMSDSNDDYIDDIFILGESENRYWLLWSHRSGRDFIGCVNKNKISKEKFEEVFFDHLQNISKQRFVVLPKPKGKITFY